MKISATLIVKNETSCLDRCLSSIRGIDEIIVCDTGSTDDTVEIARRHTKNVFTDFTWCDSFAKARNHALMKATGDWIFIIDADEFLVNSIEELRAAAIASEAKGFKTASCSVKSEKQGQTHTQPRLFKRHPDIYWKGDIHNYLNVVEDNPQDITVVYGYSEAHKLDPDRAFRILKKVVENNPGCIREKYYLAREFWYRRRYEDAFNWYENYLKVATWTPEKADGTLMAARCLWNMRKGNEAREMCLKAIGLNPDFKEAFLLMAEMHYEPNKSKWIKLAEQATNKDVLFVRTTSEQGSHYYNTLFNRSADMSRYEEISKVIAEIVKDDSVLDIGCGTAELGKKLKNYKGFDFSDKAIEIANDPRVWVGNIYDEKNFQGEFDYMVLTEVLEHIDDLKALKNIPKGQKVIFSVPSFADPAHLRTYTEENVRQRYKGIFQINSVRRFNWRNRWEFGGEPTGSYILLVEALKI
jgi:glycosyltransferase involved in cell wall biosynthesis